VVHSLRMDARGWATVRLSLRRWDGTRAETRISRASSIESEDAPKGGGKVMMADLLRWNPVDEMRRFTDMFDRQLSRWRSGSAFIGSPVDTSISNMDDAYRVRIPLPGIAPENVTVDV